MQSFWLTRHWGLLLGKSMFIHNCIQTVMRTQVQYRLWQPSLNPHRNLCNLCPFPVLDRRQFFRLDHHLHNPDIHRWHRLRPLLRRSRVLLRHPQNSPRNLSHHPRPRHLPWRCPRCPANRVHLLEESWPFRALHRQRFLGKLFRVLGCYVECCLLLCWCGKRGDGCGRDEESETSYPKCL